MRFDLIDLRLFLFVLETGSITHGAARANLSVPSASARLRGMEDAMGLPLLERGRRGVEPTPAGVTLAHHARLVRGQIERMEGELGEYARGVKAQVRLWVNTAAMAEFLPTPLARFLATRPNVDVDLKERSSVAIVKAVSAGFADIGIVYRTVDHGALALLPFAIDKLVLVVGRDASLPELQGRRDIALREIGDHPFIGLGADSPLQDYVGEHALRDGRPLVFRVRVGSFDAICRMAEQGVGLGIVPETAFKRCRRAMRIASVRLNDAWATRHLAVCARDFDTLPGYARELVAHLTAHPSAHPTDP